MIDIDITRNDGESFADFHHRATTTRATAEFLARRDRDDALAAILRADSYQIRKIIDLTGDDNYEPGTGAYVVEYRWDKRNTNDYYWVAIVNGEHISHQHFTSRAIATLHALAHLDGDDANDAAYFAARVLNIKDEAN